MKNIRLIITSVLVIGYIAGLHAQSSTDFDGWAFFNGTIRFEKKFRVLFEGQLRSNNQWQASQSYILRTGILYNIKVNQSVALGYAFLNNYRTISGTNGWSPENCIWEQYANNQTSNIGAHLLAIRNQFRLEQRFIGQSVAKDNKLETDSFAFAQRLRYQLRLVLPFLKTEDNKFVKGFYFALQDEILVNIGDKSAVNGKFFDQNRAYAATGYRFSPKIDIEMGYMYQFISGTGSKSSNNNIIQFATYFRL